MKTVRTGCFETNSSSSHSLHIFTREEWDKFENGKLLYNLYEHILTPIEQVSEDNPDYVNFEDLENDYRDVLIESYKKDNVDIEIVSIYSCDY